MTSAIRVVGEAAEVVLGEAQAVLAMVQDDERRERAGDVASALSELLAAR